jgi:hypothetical protein
MGGGRESSVGFGVDGVKDVRRRASDYCAALVFGAASNCRGRGGSRITSAILSSGAMRSLSACTQRNCRGMGRGRESSVGFGVDGVKGVRRRVSDYCAALIEGLEVHRYISMAPFNLPEVLLHVRVSILAPRCFC